MLGESEITPIEERGGMLFKRDDLFTPYGNGDVNGGKLRQCRELLLKVRPRGVVTACSIHSPQAAICAAVAQEIGIPCHVFYGGTNADSLKSLPMPRLAAAHGAHIVVAARTGRHNVLYAKARERAEERGWFVVEYGFNITEHPDVMYGAVSSQVENVPDVERLCITCGSGITTCGVLRGISEFGKNVGEVHLFCTAPDRSARISEAVPELPCPIVRHDMFHDRGFSYERREPMSYAGIELHPNYEAKAMRRMLNEGVPKEGTLFWIVGSEPKAIPRGWRDG